MRLALVLPCIHKQQKGDGISSTWSPAVFLLPTMFLAFRVSSDLVWVTHANDGVLLSRFSWVTDAWVGRQVHSP